MKILLPLLLLTAQPAKAQYESRIQYNAAALRTHFSNASDNASGIVDSRPQIMPAGGATFSRVNAIKSGFQGFQIGVGYLAYKQTTSAESRDPVDPRQLRVSTSSHLHYLSLPAELRFGKATRRGITPFVTLGGFVSKLLAYKEEMQVRVYEAPNKDYSTRDFTIANKAISTSGIYQNIPIGGSGEARLFRGIYRSWNWGLLASVGADFSIGKAHFFSVRLPMRYSLTDAERKERLEIADNNYRVLPYLPATNYWDSNSPKGLGLYQNPNGTNNRSTTHLFSYGLEIAYGFRLLRGPENSEAPR